jgi:hypothetical protein
VYQAKASTVFFLLSFVTTMVAQTTADVKSQTDWPTIMGNNTRDSRSLLKSNLTNPVIAAKYYFGGYKGYAKIVPDRSMKDENVVFDGEYPYQSLGDVEDDYIFNGFRVPVIEKTIRSHAMREDRYLSLYNNQMNYISIREGRSTAYAVRNHILSVYRVNPKTGNRDIQWTKELEFHERPHITVADMNGDGSKDIIVHGWYGTTVIDRNSHEIIMQVKQTDGWHQARKRGHSILRDIDNDGFPEEVIISIYPWDINVIENDGKKLSVKWFKVYDNQIESAQKIISAPRLPLEDYNNDGVPEIVFNVWNENGDSQWHIKALNVLNGVEVFDIPNAYIQDSYDIDGDGVLEIFASTPSGIDVPKYSNLKIYKTKGAQPSAPPYTIFQTSEAAWGIDIDSEYIETYAVHEDLNESPGFKRLVTGGEVGNKHFYICKKNTETTEINRYTLNGKDENFSITYPRGVLVNLIKENEAGDLIIEVQSKYLSPEGISINGGTTESLSWTQFNQKDILPIIAALDGGPGASVLLANTVNEVVCLDYADGAFTKRWSVDGLGMGYQYDTNRDYGIIAEDFNGDGKKEVIVRVDDGAKGGGVKCVDFNGNKLWQTEFPLIPSGKIIGFKGNVGFFSSANVNGQKRVIVNVQRHVQHTGITYSLDGITGEILWDLDVIRKGQYHESGAGAFYISAFDLDGDGIDEVMNGYGNNIWAAKANTGEVLFANFMHGLWGDYFSKNELNVFVQKILPIPIKVENKQADLLVAYSDVVTGLLHVNLSASAPSNIENRAILLWGNNDTSWSSMTNQCLADVNGDGKVEVVEQGNNNGSTKIHVYDPYTHTDIGGFINQGGIAIAADINNDGKDEIIISSGSVLYAYGYNSSNKSFVKLWEIPFGATISRPVYGDVNGDGKGEIVVTDRNGFVYLINNANWK